MAIRSLHFVLDGLDPTRDLKMQTNVDGFTRTARGKI
jgi:hypothetical protein